MAEDVGYVKISANGAVEIKHTSLEMAMEMVHHEYIYLEELYRHQIRQRLPEDDRARREDES